ncbi:hypothetical protein [Xylophilus sp. Leaf220]|uniref:hypothetical protein n=1 Tax=Xylophilus sp. Leaf220 TaxID=1735686 RepID=UPI0012E0CAF7|nr:hypothetical protein [Xylophilus sp. Leaf220]
MARNTEPLVGAALPETPAAPLPVTPVQVAPSLPASPLAVGAAPVPADGKPTKPVPEPIHPPDDYTGIGGRYIRDPETGVRTRIADPAADEAAAPATQE